MALTLEQLQFELERGSKLFKPTTTMPDGSQLVYDGNPNDVTPSTTDGEFLIHNAPIGTGFIQSTGVMWRKTVDGPGGKWNVESTSEPPVVEVDPGYEWTYSNLQPDTILHFEDLQMFVDERDVPISFETSSALDSSDVTIKGFLLELEGSVLLDVGDGVTPDFLTMETHDDYQSVKSYLLKQFYDNLDKVQDYYNIRGIGDQFYPRHSAAGNSLLRGTLRIAENNSEHKDHSPFLGCIVLKDDFDGYVDVRNSSAQSWTTRPLVIYHKKQYHVLFTLANHVTISRISGGLRFFNNLSSKYRDINLPMNPFSFKDLKEEGFDQEGMVDLYQKVNALNDWANGIPAMPYGGLEIYTPVINSHGYTRYELSDYGYGNNGSMGYDQFGNILGTKTYLWSPQALHAAIRAWFNL